ncbi:MAG: discoidin domain-containing protein [Planctomycetota bacterium]
MKKFFQNSTLGFLLATLLVAFRPVFASSVITRDQIEADWLRQEQVRRTPIVSGGANATPEQDAIGAVDGVKNGKWGFHTENEESPWWQIDLGTSVTLARIAAYNRCDIPDRASRLMILVSDDARNYRQVYQHDGTIFLGQTDKKPLKVKLDGVKARYVRLQLPGKSYFHLDEVEIYAADSNRNIALGKKATQSSVSQWSVVHTATVSPIVYPTAKVIERGLLLAESLGRAGVDTDSHEKTLQGLDRQLERFAADTPEEVYRALYLRARWVVREMSLANPLLDFDCIVFAKRVPPAFPHMSDQYYGWWSRPGGGIYILEGFRGDVPRLQCRSLPIAGSIPRHTRCRRPTRTSSPRMSSTRFTR